MAPADDAGGPDLGAAAAVADDADYMDVDDEEDEELEDAAEMLEASQAPPGSTAYAPDLPRLAEVVAGLAPLPQQLKKLRQLGQSFIWQDDAGALSRPEEREYSSLLNELGVDTVGVPPTAIRERPNFGVQLDALLLAVKDLLLPCPTEPSTPASAADTDDRRCTLIMPCGTGKSLVGLWIATAAVRFAGAKELLVLAPSTLLVKQLTLTYRALRGSEWDIFPLSSNQTAAVPAPLSTGKVRVVIACYPSFKHVKDRFIDLIILDEAHHTTPGEDAGSNIRLMSESVKGGRCKRRLFMTATPLVKRLPTEGGRFDMNDVKFYGRYVRALLAISTEE